MKGAPNAQLRFSSLSPSRQQLVRLCQSINYGYVQTLTIQAREPVLESPGPVVLIDIRLESEDWPREELAASDFALCAEVCRLMSLLDQVGNGTISKIEVRAGIPRRVTVKKQLKDVRVQQSPPAR
jgi:hypothetical protein